MLQSKVSPLKIFLKFWAIFSATQTQTDKQVISNMPTITKAFMLMADVIGELQIENEQVKTVVEKFG